MTMCEPGRELIATPIVSPSDGIAHLQIHAPVPLSDGIAHLQIHTPARMIHPILVAPGIAPTNPAPHTLGTVTIVTRLCT
jgi:hypothetical protein